MLKSSLLPPWTAWLILAALLAVLVAAESVALHTVFTSKYPGANDFFVRWLGGREYLLHGTNPFDRSVAEEAQRAMFGRLTRPEDKDEAYFAYPLYTLYFFWPLSLLPYAWAQAIWMTLLQFMLLAITMLSIHLSGWRPPAWLYWFTLFWGIFFYNGARAIILGQFSVLVGLALLLALFAIEKERYGWAGVFLAVTTIKPQMVFLVVTFLMLWGLVWRRWRLLTSFGLSMVVLVVSSMLLVPSWPLDFINNALAYSDYVAFGTPLENLLHYLLPISWAAPLTLVLSALFIVALLPGWWLALFDFRFPLSRQTKTQTDMAKPRQRNPRAGRGGAYTWAVMTTLIVGSLITFRSATTNQVILYLPIFFFFFRLVGSRKRSPPSQPPPAGGKSQSSPSSDTHQASLRLKSGRSLLTPHFLVAAIEIGLAVFMWGTFVLTIDGNWENVMMHGLLPALLLLLYALDWRGLWQTAAVMTSKSD